MTLWEEAVGLETDRVFDPTRRVDWETAPTVGIGHEFEWMLGATIDASGFRLAAFYSRRTTVAGIQQGLGISAGF